MRIVAALGGNALLRRGEAPTMDNQRHNVRAAAAALAPIAVTAELVVSHGNGPQIGLLAAQADKSDHAQPYPLDVLDAETEGMIGYLIEQELANHLPAGRQTATLLTQVEVDPDDPAFERPIKPIGAVYDGDEARDITAQRGWEFRPDGAGWRRVVPSPLPRRILGLYVIELLLRHDVLVICAGGGGIPVVRRPGGELRGIEAVIDKDRTSELLARELNAATLLMLTDVDAVYADWGSPDARAIRRITPQKLGEFSFTPGSMGPKVEAAIAFVEGTGGIAGIGALQDAAAILNGEAGTVVSTDASTTLWWD
jgi:carbamate kinase